MLTAYCYIRLAYIAISSCEQCCQLCLLFVRYRHASIVGFNENNGYIPSHYSVFHTFRQTVFTFLSTRLPKKIITIFFITFLLQLIRTKVQWRRSGIGQEKTEPERGRAQNEHVDGHGERFDAGVRVAIAAVQRDGRRG